MKHSKRLADCLSHERVLHRQPDIPFVRHAQLRFGWPESVHRGSTRGLVIVGNGACVRILVNEHKVDSGISIPVNVGSVD